MRDLRPNDLLAWYDLHARVLPWRISPADRKAGVRPDPYRVWLSEIMLQQTTVAAVQAYFLKFTKLWPKVEDLAAATDAAVMAEWAGLGYYARARNLLKCARAIANEHGGQFPSDREALLALPGIGPYTAAAVGSIAFDKPETVLDGNVERVMSRLFLVETPLPKSKPELMELAAGLTPGERAGDYAQAVMDLGATICTPKSPACGICPWRDPCRARATGGQAELPRKDRKKPKPVRLGIVYLGRRADGAWLVETRPERGLLGGMLGWPGSDWGEDAPVDVPPVQADWRDLGGEVRHTFTHFHLRLAVRVAELGADAVPDVGHFDTRFDPGALPTVMRKAYDLAIDQMAVRAE
ncbi:A/G-specific adenine glycosylase [Rhodobacteraceae bacterium]|nr:A/G-specific adenine glycosylase [Paracoccaceae bacterium]